MNMILPTPTRCSFPGCHEFADHDHHIVYDPDVVTPLCVRHHKEITMLNGIRARKIRRCLSRKYRWWIWFQWIGGTLRPGRTKRALEWVRDWDGQ